MGAVDTYKSAFMTIFGHLTICSQSLISSQLPQSDEFLEAVLKTTVFTNFWYARMDPREEDNPKT